MTNITERTISGAMVRIITDKIPTKLALTVQTARITKHRKPRRDIRRNRHLHNTTTIEDRRTGEGLLSNAMNHTKRTKAVSKVRVRDFIRKMINIINANQQLGLRNTETCRINRDTSRKGNRTSFQRSERDTDVNHSA